MTVYIGAYLKAATTKKITSSEIISTCSNPLCVKYKRSTASKFCSECGCKIENIKIEKNVERNARQLYMDKDEFVDILAPLTDNIFVPNQLPNPYRREIEPDEALDLSNINIREEKEWFIMRYKDIIQYLTNELKEDNIKICWGVILC